MNTQQDQAFSKEKISAPLQTTATTTTTTNDSMNPLLPTAPFATTTSKPRLPPNTINAYDARLAFPTSMPQNMTSFNSLLPEFAHMMTKSKSMIPFGHLHTQGMMLNNPMMMKSMVPQSPIQLQEAPQVQLTKRQSTELQPQVPVRAPSPVVSEPPSEQKKIDESKGKTLKIQKKQSSQGEEPLSSQVQKKYAQFLDSKGKLSHQDYVLSFVKIMNSEKQEKPRLVLLSVLETSTLPNCLKKFVEVNGLNLLNSWLMEYKSNHTALLAIFKVLIKLPVTVETLASSSVGKTVKKYIKLPEFQVDTQTELKQIMSKCLETWTDIVKNQENKDKKTAAKKDSETEGGLFSALGANALKKGPQINKPNDVSQAALQPDTELKKQKKADLVSRPMSVDDIRKQKQKEKIEKRKLEQLYEGQPPASDEPDKKRQKKKKRVTWAPEDKLLQIKIFEKELEAQDISVQHHESNPKGIAYLDKQQEKMQLQQQKKKLEDMQPTTGYPNPPILFDNIPMVSQTTESKRQSSRVAEKAPTRYSSIKEIPVSPASPLKENEYNDSSVPSIAVENIAPYNSPYDQKTEQALSALQSLATDPNILQSLLGLISNQSTENYPPQRPMYPSTIPSAQPPRQELPHLANYPPQAHMPNMYNTSPQYGTGLLPYPSHQSQASQVLRPPSNNPYNPYSNTAPLMSAPLPPNVQPIMPQPPMPDSKSIRCKFYLSKIGCKRGNTCKFYHEGVDPIPPNGVQDYYEEDQYNHKGTKRR